MTKEPNPFTDQDFPVEHLYAPLDHITAPARDEIRVAYLRGMPRGTALAEAQAVGTELASTVLDSLYDQDDISFAVDTIAPASLNSAWYSAAKGMQAVQRRRLKIPKFNQTNGTILEPSEFWDKGRQQMQGAMVAAETVARSTRNGSPRLERHKILFMRQTGHAALALTCSQIEPTITELSPYEAQLKARLQCQKLISTARNLGETIGRHPSLAQLADPDSDLSVYWRRRAPNGARAALLNAVELRRAAA